MRAARLHGPGDLRVADEPTPAVAPDHELVRVEAVGICGSDLHWFDEGAIGDAAVDEPLVIGHEFAGRIAEGPRAGTLVAVDPAVPCDACRWCRRGDENLCDDMRFAGHGRHDGGLREFVAWPRRLLHPLPAGMSAIDGALLEPLGVALHAVDLAHVGLGATVAVVGCGPIGLLVVRAARLAGASRVVAVEPLAHRRAAAVAGGADVVVTPDEARDPTLDGVADVAVEAGGTDDAVDLSLRLAGKGARVVLVGIPDGDSTTFRASRARRKALSLVLCRRMRAAYPRAIDLAASGRIDLSVLDATTFPLDRVEAAFAHALERRGTKVVVVP